MHRNLCSRTAVANGKKEKKYSNLLSTEHHQVSNVRHDSMLCRTRQMGAAAEHCDIVSSLALTPVLLQTALHIAVRLALIAEQTLFGHEHRLDHNESRLLVQDRSQLV